MPAVIRVTPSAVATICYEYWPVAVFRAVVILCVAEAVSMSSRESNVHVASGWQSLVRVNRSTVCVLDWNIAVADETDSAVRPGRITRLCELMLT